MCKKLKIIKDKKAGHVGMILSFVIFITFLVFLYSVIQPVTEIERGKQDLLEYLNVELMKEFSADMTTSTININANVNQPCVKFRTVNGTEEMNVIAKSKENLLQHKKSDDGKYITINRDFNGDGGVADFLKIYYSEEFKDTDIEDPCAGAEPETLLEDEDYVLGLVRTEEHIFESKIISMVDSFESEYSEIKEKLKIAPGNEFGFSFTNSSGNTMGTTEKNVSVNIYVEQIPIQYINSEANIKPGYLNVRVW